MLLFRGRLLLLPPLSAILHRIVSHIFQAHCTSAAPGFHLNTINKDLINSPKTPVCVPSKFLVLLHHFTPIQLTTGCNTLVFAQLLRRLLFVCPANSLFCSTISLQSSSLRAATPLSLPSFSTTRLASILSTLKP